VEADQVLFADVSAPAQESEQGEGRETRILAARRPTQRAETQYVTMLVQRVQNVSRFVSTSRPASASTLLIAKSTRCSTNPNRSWRTVGRNRQLES
jgi:hypothetical protein